MKKVIIALVSCLVCSIAALGVSIFSASSKAESPSVVIGSNGNWVIDGKDTGIKAADADENDCYSGGDQCSPDCFFYGNISLGKQRGEACCRKG